MDRLRGWHGPTLSPKLLFNLLLAGPNFVQHVSYQITQLLAPTIRQYDKRAVKSGIAARRDA
jgi:hypothetical protein